jgi:hypothetical protein
MLVPVPLALMKTTTISPLDTVGTVTPVTDELLKFCGDETA